MFPIHTKIVVLLLLLLCIPALSAFGYADTPDIPATDINRYFETIREDETALSLFFDEMPKGGDTHIHLSGALPPQDLIAIAARHNLLVDPATAQLVDPATGQPAGYVPEQPLVPVSSAYTNTSLFDILVSRWSMAGFPYKEESGHDWFFATFDLIDPVTYYDGELIARVRDTAAAGNIRYLELMTSQTNSKEVDAILDRVFWNDNLTILRKELLDAGIREICQDKVQIQEEYDQISREHATPAGRNVTVRYIYEALRFLSEKEVFCDLLQAFEIADQSPLIVGISLVGEEADPDSLSDYHLHMQMIASLQQEYPNVSVSLHAGELTPALVPENDLEFHITDAIITGNASRISHGVSIMHETNREETLKRMAQSAIPIEILLSSNLQILGVKADEHPVFWYLASGVPVILSTDDPGVFGISLADEYVTLTISHPEITYEQVREINRNSIRYSLLSEKEKEEMLADLEADLVQFEQRFAATRMAGSQTMTAVA